MSMMICIRRHEELQAKENALIGQDDSDFSVLLDIEKGLVMFNVPLSIRIRLHSCRPKGHDQDIYYKRAFAH